MHATATSKAETQTRARRIVQRTRGHSQGSITRLVSPSDVGELIKPFVFLDYFDIDPQRIPALGFHPHSGIATVTVVLEGQVSYEETSGTKGVVDPGGVDGYAQAAASGIPGVAAGSARAKGFQLWVALPPEMENIASEARYLGREQFQSSGPARVILGRLGEAASKVPAPAVMNYLDVALKKGEKWRYDPPDDHTVRLDRRASGKAGNARDRGPGRAGRVRGVERCPRIRSREDTGFILARPSSIPTTSCSATTPFTRASRRSTEAKRKSPKSASASARKAALAMAIPKIAIIISTTRATRFGEKPAKWIHGIAAARTT